MVDRPKVVLSTGQCYLPDIDRDTAVIDNVTVPRKRKALFLSVSNDVVHDSPSDELSFSALSTADRATFQLLLYLTYCCKGTVLQVTLEDPDFVSMSPPIREDNAHGRLFCFILNMDNDNEVSSGDGSTQVQPDSSQVGYTPSNYLLDLLDMDAGIDVFGQDDVADVQSDDEDDEDDDEELHKQAFSAFMRLQLVRKKLSSLNNAMVAMKDDKAELSAIFHWVDIVSDALNSKQLDKKTVKELQGSLYTPVCQSGKTAVVLPQSITRLKLKTLETSISTMTDICLRGEGQTLFRALMASLGPTRWLEQSVMSTYNPDVPGDVAHVEKLKAFTRDLARGSQSRVDSRGLIVFRYTLDSLIDSDTPDLFTRSMLHKHVPVNRSVVDVGLRKIRTQRRTLHLARMLDSGRCDCSRGSGDNMPCRGQCYAAYACYYNHAETHPFVTSKNDHSYCFAHLFPQLGKVERMSKEMKQEYGGRDQFELIADMVFTILTRRHFGERDAIYVGLHEVVDGSRGNASLSLGHHLPDIHSQLCRTVCDDGQREYASVKVYDAAVVKHLFCDTLAITRLFQASTTFNYIITNTAPRYTIERIMLLNITGPGEGKSYANNVLEHQFRAVRNCIERLTSFTMQAFKYKQKRNACVVMIDDAHITHEKNTKSIDRESNVIPNTFKNLLDTSTLESDVVTKDPMTGKIATVKFQAVHNCGFVWNTNTMGFMSDAWADRCLIMESEHPKEVSRTRSTVQIRDVVEKRKMDRIAALCLYRQNLIQSATMIADSEVVQFGVRFDSARDACVAAFYETHIECAGMVGRRVAFCINQLVFAEAMKLACHFVFDIWIPPWTRIPDKADYPDCESFTRTLNENRLRALNKLSFGQICLETNAVYKLCTAACLPDICPRALDSQGRFACKVLGYVLTQVYEQKLKTTIKNGSLSVSGIEDMFFSAEHNKDDNGTAHEMLMLCSTCKVPARSAVDSEVKTRKLCTYRLSHSQLPSHVKRGRAKVNKKVSTVTLSLEMLYDMLATYAPDSHAGFWSQVTSGMVESYEQSADEEEWENAMGQCYENANERPPQCPRLSFTLDFTEDPLRSLVLEATAGVKALDELTFHRCVLGGETFQCSAPLYYGAVLLEALGEEAPDLAYNESHLKEANVGPRHTFHGPRLTVYSGDYAGVPVKNMSSFCKTRTTYHQDQVLLTNDTVDRDYLFELEEDWEWKDACDVFNHVFKDDIFTVDMLKRDYAATMITMVSDYRRSGPCRGDPDDGRTALALRRHTPLTHGGQREDCSDPTQCSHAAPQGKRSQKRKQTPSHHHSSQRERSHGSKRGSSKKHRCCD